MSGLNEKGNSFIEKMNNASKRSNIRSEDEAIFRLAAVCVEFNIEVLKDIVEKSGHSVSDYIRTALENNSWFDPETNTYELKDHFRTRMLSQLSVEEISSLINQIDDTTKDWRQRLYERMLQNKVSGTGSLQPEEYMQAYVYSRWIKHPQISVPDEKLLLPLIRHRELLRPLEKLTTNFAGRTKELEELRAFVEKRFTGTTNKKEGNLFISGVGGVGKSTLVYKFILDLLNDTKYGDLPFIRIDFDNPGYSIANLFTLVKEALNQLSLQFVQHKNSFDELIKRINDEFLDNYTEDMSLRDSARKFFFNDSIRENEKRQLLSLTTPVLLVFDSFEEIQFRATKPQLDSLFEFIAEIRELIPMLKVLFVGRSELAEYNEYGVDKVITELDIESTGALLHSLGIADVQLQENIFRRFGGNPLTVQLTGNLVLKEFGDTPITNAAVEERGLFAKIDKAVIHQQLVTRNLDHLHNKELAAIAVPGILLRRINSDIIKNVLAGPCGLGEIDDEKADYLFSELKKERFLLRETEYGVEFRKDLRSSVYDLVLQDPKYNALDVHDAAIDYYQDKTDPASRAEYLYHRLKKGDDPAIIKSLYKEDMRSFLESALSELNKESRLSLSASMGITIPVNIEEISQERWQIYMTAQIRNVMKGGDEIQLFELLKRLRARQERVPDPEFEYFEELVYARLNLFEEYNRRSDLAARKSAIPIPKLQLLIHYYKEYEQNWLNVGTELYDGVDYVETLPTNMEGLSVMVEYYCSLTRLFGRTHRDLDESTPAWESRKRVHDLIVQRISESEEALRLAPKDIISLFPKYYRIPLSKRYKEQFPAADLLAKPNPNRELNRFFLTSMLENCLGFFGEIKRFETGEQFDAHYRFLSVEIKTAADLERYARRFYKVYSKDISLPGSLDVCLFDFLLFAEAMPRDTNRLKLIKLSKISDFDHIKNRIVSEDLVNSSEVLACVDRLEKAFVKNGKNELVVSDILDNEGNQYVNLVMQGSGVHHWSLLGYTYILERMNIRFLKIAGTSMGSVNAALLGVTGKRNEANSQKALDILTSRDYLSLIDGRRPLKWFVKKFGSERKFISRFISFILPYFFFLVTGVILVSSDISRRGLPTRFNGQALMLIMASVLFVVSFWFMVNVLLLSRKVLRFGGGLSPGKVFSEWLKEIFSQNDVGSVADFIKKTTSAPPLTSREGKFNTALLKPSVQFISADVVTQNRIVFPDMARLFWSGSKLELIDPSLFVRAAASIPFFFESVIVDKLSAEDPEIKNAWLELFGEYRPPKSACLVDGNIVPVFPITFFQTPGTPDAPMPTFGVSTMSSYETLDAENVHKLPWSKYLSRLLDTSKYNRTSNEVSHDNAMQKGMCRIELSVTSWLDFGLDDARKLWLFTRGAEAATNFLLKFNWEEYKRSLNLSTALRV